MDEVDESNMSFEPMDVDLSGNSVTIMDISSNSYSDNSRRRNFKYRENLSPKKNNHQIQGQETSNSKLTVMNSFDNTKLVKPIKLKPFDNIELNKPFKLESFDNIELDKPTNGKKEKSSGTVIKKYNIRFKKQKGKKPNSFLKIIGLGLFFLGIAFLLHSINNLKCSIELDVDCLKSNLSKNLFGQKFAVDDILDALSMEVQSKVLFLYGGTGVGKTFAVSFILNSMLPSSNTYHYTMPSFVNTFSTELMLGLTLCDYSMIIVDDLSVNDDIIINSHIKEVLGKSEKLGKNITIILIFNCEIIQKDFIKKCDISFESNLKKAFSDVKAVKTFIKFNPLSEEHLKKCIEREIKDVVQEVDMMRIMANFNVSLDGCKGVFHKIKF